jgi:hypothetical protein
MDRTAELYMKLDAEPKDSGFAAVEIVLAKRDFVKSPAHTDRNVYGPGTIRLEWTPNQLTMIQR